MDLYVRDSILVLFPTYCRARDKVCWVVLPSRAQGKANDGAVVLHRAEEFLVIRMPSHGMRPCAFLCLDVAQSTN